jgi:hypothetical protein
MGVTQPTQERDITDPVIYPWFAPEIWFVFGLNSTPIAFSEIFSIILCNGGV